MNKKRYWAFVLYPESAPIDWIEFLQRTGLPIAISPLHDSDIDPTGEPKKEHYHIILCYDGPTTFNNVKKNITEPLNQPIPIPLEQVRGYFRYLTHKDNPDKFQYNDKDIVLLNDFDESSYNNLTQSEVNSIKLSAMKYVRDHKITEYYDLVNAFLDEENFNFVDVISCHTIFFNTYITSYRHKTIDKDMLHLKNKLR